MKIKVTKDKIWIRIKNLMSMIETKHLATSTSAGSSARIHSILAGFWLSDSTCKAYHNTSTSVVSDCSVTSAGSSARIHSILAGFWLSDSTCKAYHNTSTSVVSDCSVTSAGSSARIHSILAGFWLSDSTCKAYHNTSTSVVSDCSVTSAGSSARIHSILAGFWLSGGDASTMTTPSCGGIIPQFLATLMAVLIMSPAISAGIKVHASTTTWMCTILSHILTRQRKADLQIWTCVRPKINRVPLLIMNNLHVKFESEQAKTVVCIVPTKSYTQNAEVDFDLWPHDLN